MTSINRTLHRQYYNREYESRPSSPSSRRRKSPTPLAANAGAIHTNGTNNATIRRPSPPKSPSSYRKDYSRSQYSNSFMHQQYQQQNQQEEEQDRLNDNNYYTNTPHKKISYSSRRNSTMNENNLGSTNNGDHMDLTGKNTVGSSPNSVMGLNVKDLASRYGGGNTRNTQQQHPHRRRFSRSPVKSKKNTFAKTKVDENDIDNGGGVECTLASTTTDSDLNESRDTTTAAAAASTTASFSPFPSPSSKIRHSSQVQQRLREMSRSPVMGQSYLKRSNPDIIKKEDTTVQKEESTVQKKWGWPSPKRYEVRRNEQILTKSNSLDSYSSQQKQQQKHVLSERTENLEEKNGPIVGIVNSSGLASKSQYLQILKQSRNHKTTSTRTSHNNNVGIGADNLNESTEVNITSLVETSPLDISQGAEFTSKPYISEARKNVQNRWGRSNTTTTTTRNKFKKYSNHTLNDSTSNFESPKVQEDEDQNKVLNKTPTKEIVPKAETTTKETTEDDNTTPEQNNVLEKAHFWRNQLSNQRSSRARSPITSIQRKKLSSGELKSTQDRIISKSKSADSLLDKKDDGKDEKVVHHPLKSSKIDAASNAFFSKHIQYMQSKSQNQYQYKDQPSSKITLRKETDEKRNNFRTVKVSEKGETSAQEVVDKKETRAQGKDRNWSFQQRREVTSVENKNQVTTYEHITDRGLDDQAKNDSIDESESQRKVDSLPPVATDEKNDESYLSLKSKSFDSSQPTSYRSRINNKHSRERIDSPNVSISSSYDENLRQAQLNAKKNSPVSQKDVNKCFESNGSPAKTVNSKFSKTNPTEKVSVKNEIPLSTPTKESPKFDQTPKKNSVLQQKQYTTKVTSQRTAMEKFIEDQSKLSPMSLSPSRKSLHERIRKFDTGGEVPMPVPHCKMVEKRHFQSSPKSSPKRELEPQEENIILEDRNSFKPILHVSDYESNFEHENEDCANDNEHGEESTIAEKSQSLSVSEAKARLWDTNEKLQAWPKHPQNDVPAPSPSSSTRGIPNFKSKLFVRAAEAAQTIRKTNSMESRESNAQEVNKLEGKNHLERANCIQTSVISPQTSNPQSGYSHPSSNAVNPRHQVKKNIQSKMQNQVNLDKHKDMRPQTSSSIAQLMAKLASVKRDDPTAALKAIDSILQSERRELGIIEEEEGSAKSYGGEQSKRDTPILEEEIDNIEHAMSEKDEESSYDSDSDDSTVSAITDPTYQSGFIDTSSVISYSTVSRNGKKRQFSYHVTKDGPLHQQYTATRISSSLHRNKKINGHMVHATSTLQHQTKMSKEPNALNTSFESEALNSSLTMVSPPIVERKTEKDASDGGKRSTDKRIRGGMSSDNQSLLRKINTWDESEKPTVAGSSTKQPASPTCSERIQRIAAKENLSPGDKIKKLARVADEKSETLKRVSPGRRFLYPQRNQKSNNSDTRKIQGNENNGDMELPENVASAFDDVNISFGSQNVYAFQKEMNYSFLSPLARKFKKVEQRYMNNDP